MSSTSGSQAGARNTTILKWVGTLVSLVLLIILLGQQGWDKILQAVAQIPAWRFAAAAALMVVSRFAVTGRWFALLRATQEKPSFLQTVRLTFAGLFSSNFLPTTIGGDIVRLAGAVQYGMDGTVIAASLIVDRLVGVGGMLLAVPFGLIPMWAWFMQQQGGDGAWTAPIILMVGGGTFRKIWQRIIDVFRKIFQAIKTWLNEPLALLTALGFTAIHMLCFFGIFWLLFAGLGEPIPFSMVAGLYSFVYLVTLLPISINSYGLQEISISLIFSNVAGVSMQSSLTVALIFRTLMLLASLPGALFVPGIIEGRRREAQTAVENDPEWEEDVLDESEN